MRNINTQKVAVVRPRVSIALSALSFLKATLFLLFHKRHSSSSSRGAHMSPSGRRRRSLGMWLGHHRECRAFTFSSVGELESNCTPEHTILSGVDLPPDPSRQLKMTALAVRCVRQGLNLPHSWLQLIMTTQSATFSHSV